jgi:hypothetical protein
MNLPVPKAFRQCRALSAATHSLIHTRPPLALSLTQVCIVANFSGEVEGTDVAHGPGALVQAYRHISQWRAKTALAYCHGDGWDARSRCCVADFAPVPQCQTAAVAIVGVARCTQCRVKAGIPTAAAPRHPAPTQRRKRSRHNEGKQVRLLCGVWQNR